MDRRHRAYYYVNLNQNYRFGGWWTTGYDDYGRKYQDNLRTLMRLIPSIKIKPLGLTRIYDYVKRSDYYQLQISCRYEDEELMINTLRSLPMVNFEEIEED